MATATGFYYRGVNLMFKMVGFWYWLLISTINKRAIDPNKENKICQPQVVSLFGGVVIGKID